MKILQTLRLEKTANLQRQYFQGTFQFVERAFQVVDDIIPQRHSIECLLLCIYRYLFDYFSIDFNVIYGSLVMLCLSVDLHWRRVIVQRITKRIEALCMTTGQQDVLSDHYFSILFHSLSQFHHPRDFPLDRLSKRQTEYLASIRELNSHFSHQYRLLAPISLLKSVQFIATEEKHTSKGLISNEEKSVFIHSNLSKRFPLTNPKQSQLKIITREKPSKKFLMVYQVTIKNPLHILISLDYFKVVILATQISGSSYTLTSHVQNDLKFHPLEERVIQLETLDDIPNEGTIIYEIYRIEGSFFNNCIFSFSECSSIADE